ncbi:chymotrypsin/elastase isoinhibitor 1 [Microplitis demolitor]|uniref:chymotrypsin/elastase isoinhibitor 1 n=1 Tax=Microplitis demolitor TaxID=69319 RepID=UPI0004CC997A|nr:chymotrypsin/elastase isoinhibitor 1 [Microplitis demolitor]
MSRFLLTNIFLLALVVACVYADGECTEECGENEECNSCGDECELNCSDLTRVACPLICNPPACVCKEGFARDDNSGTCINKLQCPMH